MLDSTGVRIGIVHAFGITEAGSPRRLVLRRGHILHRDTVLPLEWVKEIGDDGVLLRDLALQYAQQEREAQPPTS